MVEWIVGLAITYLAGSNLKDAVIAASAAKMATAATPTLSEAAAELSTPVLK